jgi:phosphatidate phosphatase APP1
MNMPSIFANWSSAIPGAHFHYLTTTPEQVTRAYESFIFSQYPLGSFDVRPENFTTVDQTLSIRKVTLWRVLESFPQRKFVLIADTSNADVMKDYPLARATFGDRVQVSSSARRAFFGLTSLFS